MLRLLVIGMLLLPVDVFAGAMPEGDSQPFVKCGTPAYLAEYMSNQFRFMSSTRYYGAVDVDAALPVHAVSQQGHFRAHYDTTGTNAPSLIDTDGNGVPDYVDSTLVYLEYAWDLIINQLGYSPPRSDEGRGGGDEVDVYILNMYGYGETHPEATVNGVSAAYMIIDNNYNSPQYQTKGYAALRVTTAHEFFHVIHFSYFTDMSMHWWMEQSAVWMEERAWDDVNDYLPYLNYFFNQKMTSLNNNDTYNYYMYGAGIWPMYLAKRFGDDQIRLIWEYAKNTGNHTITAFDAVIPGSLAEAFSEFATWNYFIGPRANNNFYDDALLFDVSDVVDAIYPSPLGSVGMQANALTSRYIEFQFDSFHRPYTLHIELIPWDGPFIGKLILYSDSGEFQIKPLIQGLNQVYCDPVWDRMALVMSCSSTFGTGFAFEFHGDIPITLAEETTVPEAFTVSPPQPNPFNPATSIGFTMPSSGEVTITAFNLQGQATGEIARGYFPAGTHRLDWRPENLAGGVYLIRVVSPYGVKTIKSLYLK